MKKIKFFCSFGLFIYSAILLGYEIIGYHEQIKFVYANIVQPLKVNSGNIYFYAINTSLVTFLLFGTVIILVISLIYHANKSGEILFYWSQIILFVILGLCERFLTFSNAYQLFDIHPDFILVALATLESFIVLVYLNTFLPQETFRSYFYKAIVFFVIILGMDALDIFFKDKLILKVFIKNISKSWFSLYIFLFFWEILNYQMGCLLEDTGHALTNKIVASRTLSENLSRQNSMTNNISSIASIRLNNINKIKRPDIINKMIVNAKK